MLNFDFGPTLEEDRAKLRELAPRELLPLYQEHDAQQRYPDPQIRRIIRSRDSFWKGREDERDLVSVGITAEEVARGDITGVLPSLGPVSQNQCFADSSSSQRARWLPGLLAGDFPLALAITEAQAGSAVEKLEMRAEPRGVHYVLNGVKNSVSFLDGEVIYVFARSEPGASGRRRDLGLPAGAGDAVSPDFSPELSARRASMRTRPRK